MSTKCIQESMSKPLDILKGCSCILTEMDSDFSENIYSANAISLLADLITDAVSRLDDEKTETR